jgi:hypothetical protein
MLEGGDGRSAFCTGVAQGTSPSEAVVSVNMEPHRIWLAAGFPALWTKLEHTRFFNGYPFADCLQIRFGDPQGVG